MAFFMTEDVQAGIVGANGYNSFQPAKLLINHSLVNIHILYTKQPQWSLDEEWTQVTPIPNLPLEELDSTVKDLDVILFATPPQVSTSLIQELFTAQGSSTACKV